MADLLSHVLIAFIIFTAVSWVWPVITPRLVVMGMVGAIVPDLNRWDLIVSGEMIASNAGIPFDWGAIHTFGGVVIISALITLAFAKRSNRLHVFGMLIAGGVSHLFVDALRIYADGFSNALFYPLSWWRPPAINLYVSSDPMVTALVLTIAVVIGMIDRYIIGRT